MKLLVSSVALAVSLIALGRPADAAPAIAEGKPFPRILLPALGDGSPMSIADFRGQRLVLQIFASW